MDHGTQDDAYGPHIIRELYSASYSTTANLLIRHSQLSQSIHELNELVLENVLIHLPLLTGLHVINCSKMDHNAVLRLTSFTPDLQSLSFTTWVCFVDSALKPRTDESLRTLRARWPQTLHSTGTLHRSGASDTSP